MAVPDPAREIALRNRNLVGGVLRSLRAIVAELGYVGRDHERVVADVFNISHAEIRGIVSFYHDLKTQPGPPLEVRICQAEACQAVGGRDFTRQAEDYLGLRLGEANDFVALNAVYCLGLCAQGPSMTVNQMLVAHASIAQLAEHADKRRES